MEVEVGQAPYIRCSCDPLLEIGPPHGSKDWTLEAFIDAANEHLDQFDREVSITLKVEPDTKSCLRLGIHYGSCVLGQGHEGDCSPYR
jgi:hypothetical protein